MPTPPRPHGQVTPAPEEVNESIRHLMEQPATPQRTEAYQRLLEAWAATSADRLTEAA
ncbi:hypothetical protein [Streptomyces sp. NPDC056291]|uniref:hypothetical protein n=1 Tax=Streptomyces sp. NPDC056291 TaxID=3345772 RepID=UPI0035D9ABBA